MKEVIVVIEQDSKYGDDIISVISDRSELLGVLDAYYVDYNITGFKDVRDSGILEYVFLDCDGESITLCLMEFELNKI